MRQGLSVDVLFPGRNLRMEINFSTVRRRSYSAREFVPFTSKSNLTFLRVLKPVVPLFSSVATVLVPVPVPVVVHEVERARSPVTVKSKLLL